MMKYLSVTATEERKVEPRRRKRPVSGWGVVLVGLSSTARLLKKWTPKRSRMPSMSSGLIGIWIP